MDWKSITFDWNQARAFLVTAEEGSLSAAARALDMAQPTLGRQVSALESQLGVVLFERVGGRLSLTSTGLELLQHVKDMGEAANRLSLAATKSSDTMAGVVCISASEIHASYLIPPIIEKLREAEPRISLKVVSSNQASDLLRREADIAIRSFRPTENELIAKKIKDVAAPFYAAKTYIKKFGSPANLDNLKHVQFLAIGDKNAFLKQMVERGFTISEDNLIIESDSHVVHWELVKQGLGIGIVPADVGDREPLVERTLSSIEPLSFPIWLTTHRELNSSKRIRFVFDFLAEQLQ